MQDEITLRMIYKFSSTETTYFGTYYLIIFSSVIFIQLQIFPIYSDYIFHEFIYFNVKDYVSSYLDAITVVSWFSNLCKWSKSQLCQTFKHSNVPCGLSNSKNVTTSIMNDLYLFYLYILTNTFINYQIIVSLI